MTFPSLSSLFPSSVWGGGGVFGPFGHWLPGHRPLPAGHQRLRQRQLSQRATVVQRSAGGRIAGLHPLQYSRWALWGEASSPKYGWAVLYNRCFSQVSRGHFLLLHGWGLLSKCIRNICRLFFYKIQWRWSCFFFECVKGIDGYYGYISGSTEFLCPGFGFTKKFMQKTSEV